MARFQFQNNLGGYVVTAVLFDGTQESVGEINKMVEDEGRTNFMVEYILNEDGNLEEHAFVKGSSTLRETKTYEPGTYISSDVSFPLTQEEIDEDHTWTLLNGSVPAQNRFYQTSELSATVEPGNVGNPEDMNKPGGQISPARTPVGKTRLPEEGGEEVENPVEDDDEVAAQNRASRDTSENVDTTVVRASTANDAADQLGGESNTATSAESNVGRNSNAFNARANDTKKQAGK
jgi:hypothetical protein